MPVLHLTIFLSLILSVIFIVCFALEAWKGRKPGSDHTALLPLLDDDAEVPATKHSNKSN